MHKFSYALAERFRQDPLETYFCKQHPLELEKINYLSMTLVIATFFEAKKYSTQ